MSSDPDNASLAERLSQELLGTSSSAQPEDQVSISMDTLRTALKAAYQRGVVHEHAVHSSNDPDLFFWQLMDTLPDHVYFKDLRSRFTCVNRSQARFLGLDDPNDAIGLSDFDFFPEGLAKTQFADEQEIINTGEGYFLHEEKYVENNNEQRCLVASKLPLRDAEGTICGTFGISRDITNRYLAEREVERQKNLLEAIIRILPCRIFVRDRENKFILINEPYQSSLGVPKPEELIGHRLSEFTEESRIKTIREEDKLVREQGESILNKVEFDRGPFEKEKWVVTSKVPLRGPDNSIEGIVGMTYDITEQKEAEEEAHRLSEELREKNAQYEVELLVARQLQEKLMSMGFDTHRRLEKTGPNWRVSASYFYKPSHHLAGDFFELIPISESKVGILVCDVMGHGVKAALVTMLLRGLISEFTTFLDRPAQVLGQLNSRLCTLAEDQEFPRFTTAVYLTLDLETGAARVANGGHPGPLWKSRDKSGRECFEPCPAGEIGPALGLIPDLEYEQHEFACDEATEFLLYTDGIIEQKDAIGHEFGIRKLEDILLNNEAKSVESQLSTIKSALRLTAGTENFDDDICLVALKMRSLG